AVAVRQPDRMTRGLTLAPNFDLVAACCDTGKDLLHRGAGKTNDGVGADLLDAQVRIGDVGHVRISLQDHDVRLVRREVQLDLEAAIPEAIDVNRLRLAGIRIPQLGTSDL